MAEVARPSSRGSGYGGSAERFSSVDSRSMVKSATSIQEELGSLQSDLDVINAGRKQLERSTGRAELIVNAARFELQKYDGLIHQSRSRIDDLNRELGSLSVAMSIADAKADDPALESSLEASLSGLGELKAQQELLLQSLERDRERVRIQGEQQTVECAQKQQQLTLQIEQHSQRMQDERVALQREFAQIKEELKKAAETAERHRADEHEKRLADLSLMLLLNGALVEKCNSNGKSHNVYVYLSPDRTTVLWRDDIASAPSSERSLSLGSVTKIAPGRTTDVFRKQTVMPSAEDIARSLSLISPSRTLDLVFSSAELAKMWTAGLNRLLGAGAAAAAPK